MGKRKRRKFSNDFKEEAIKLISDQGYTIAEVARNLGIHATQLSRWKKDIEEPNIVDGVGNMVAYASGVEAPEEGEQTAQNGARDLKKGCSLLRKGTGIRYQFIDTKKKAFPISLLCKVMRVSRSGFYSWASREKSSRQVERDRLISKVKEIHRKVRETYGTRRMSIELTTEGESCGRTKAVTLMTLAMVKARQKKKFKVTANSRHKLPVAPNLLNRNFTVSMKDTVYCSDITYIWTREGWLYLAVVLDLYSRKVVGWSMSNRITKALVSNALQMAFWRRRPVTGLIFHSDRGSQYCSNSFRKLFRRNQIKSSMSRKGDCWDNSVAESFFGTLKTE
jgi:transposase InsO family protein/transposase-like protein